MVFKCKVLISLFFYTSLVTQSLIAQERVIIKLDGGMTPVLNENFGTHKYNQIITTGTDSSSISKIYDLKNRLFSQTKEKYNEELGYNEAIISKYDTLQNLISSEIKNVDNGSFVRVFLDEEKVVSRLEYFSGQVYKFYLGESETPTIESEKNPMVLQANYEMSEYNRFLAQNLKYPQQARERKEMGTVLLKLDINEAGEVSEISCLNKNELYKPLINEAIRVVKAFNPSFIAPIDIYGNKTSTMARVPIRFKLS
ncbi:TonB family C-terminal domain-containing protein [Algoriphagus aquimarinus]|uniref:TonB family C-terminal domain-containing protein n=1 Tax=Algoriphagus aquimarinus TaxID=237018 RepID=A0A1I0YV64_9BACT|nr:TonB family C-terminal domain-containing protein [Algoriphagus aquimarinus]